MALRVRRTILVPARALAVLVGMVVGGVLIALDLARAATASCTRHRPAPR